MGRPFPLEQADEHFNRLRAWGFTFLRLLTTWEAIEHEGPGIYDTDYLDYLYQIVKKAAEFGIDVFIDPHQDVWSRFSGGDGAPGWTFEAVGMDVTRFQAAGAAILHQEQGDPFPRMIWPTNYDKLAAATLFTLFFGGSDFAPRLQIEGVPVQEFLQGHYINAVAQVARRLRDLPNVVGYDTLNEPSSGFIGAENVSGRAKSVLRKGDAPTIFQTMLLGAGIPQEIDVYETGLRGIRKVGSRLVNAGRQSVWREGCEDIWKQHGVWGLDAAGQGEVLVPDYFNQVGGRKINFYRDYFKPFANRFAAEIRAVSPDALIFVEGVPAEGDLTWTVEDAPNVVHAAHWYDGLTLLTKSFRTWLTLDYRNVKPVIGSGSVRRCFANQIADSVRQSDEQMNHAPTLIGEVGIPFDMQDKRAYRTGDFSMQVKALDATLFALEDNFTSFTLWNYTADNTNAHGDQWNDEDLSLFSRDQMTGSGSIYDGGRALAAAVRPYPRKISGEPLDMTFDIRTKRFEFRFHHTPGIQAPTEIFIPTYQYPNGCQVEVSDGTYELDLDHQTLTYHHSDPVPVHTIRVKPLRTG